MAGALRQSTAAQSRALGPFISDTDFKTVQTALTIANTDIKLVVNGAASVNKNSGGGTHRINGVYGVTFDATDTATVGELDVSVVVAGALPVFDKFTVVEEAVYDRDYAASALGYVATQVIGTYTGNTPQTGDSFARIGAAGAGLTAIDLPDQTMNITGNITGNLSGSVGSVTGAVGSVTAGVTVTTNSDKTGYGLTAGERTSVADALLDRDLASGVDSGSPTVRTPRQALRFSRNKWAIAAGTLTVTKEDDTTPSWTATVTQTAGNPVSQVDPA